MTESDIMGVIERPAVARKKRPDGPHRPAFQQGTRPWQKKYVLAATPAPA